MCRRTVARGRRPAGTSPPGCASRAHGDDEARTGQRRRAEADVTAGIEDRLRDHFHDLEDLEGPLATPDPAAVASRARARRRPSRSPVYAGWRPRRPLLVIGGLAAGGALAVTALVVA